jgi:hypothetical protein
VEGEVEVTRAGRGNPSLGEEIEVTVQGSDGEGSP